MIQVSFIRCKETKTFHNKVSITLHSFTSLRVSIGFVQQIFDVRSNKKKFGSSKLKDDEEFHSVHSGHKIPKLCKDVFWAKNFPSFFTQSCKFLDGALKRTIAAIKNNFLEREKTFFFDPLRSVFFSSEAASFESNFYWTITQLETDIGSSSSTDWSDTKTAGSRADKWAERAGRGRRQPGR